MTKTLNLYGKELTLIKILMSNIKNKFALIGEFVYNFELVVSRLRMGCRVVVERGEVGQNRAIFIVFSQRLWSAEPLLSVFESLVNEGLKGKKNEENDKLLAEFSLFRKDFMKMIEFRNLLLHGEHQYGEEIGMSVSKPAQSRKGMEVKTVLENEEELVEKIVKLNQLCQDSLHLVLRLSMATKLD